MTQLMDWWCHWKENETWEQCEDEIQNIFKENLGFENIDREHIAQKGRRAAINQELFLVSFVLQAREANTLELKESER